MKYLPQGSLRSFLNIPQVRPHDLSQVPTTEAGKRVHAYWSEVANSGDEAAPDREAIEFYCLNHLTSIIQQNFDQNEVLPDWAQEVVKEYVRVLSQQGRRLYAYLLLICTRESRHLQQPDLLYPLFLKEFGKHAQVLWNFNASIRGTGSTTAAKAVCEKPPNVPLGPYVRSLEFIFAKGKFGSSFGGPKWAACTKPMREMVMGQCSIELMVDIGYSLAHNGGPIFNKGMLYGQYEHGFIKILDVQRGGQMPEAVLNGELPPQFIPAPLKTLVATVKEHFPKAIGDYVDWNKVEQLGALHKYTTEKKKMPKAPPKPTLIGGMKAIPAGELEILPGIKVPMIKRVAA